MGLARSWSVSLHGLEGSLVEVEADVSSGLPAFVLIGLPATALTEARDGLRGAGRRPQQWGAMAARTADRFALPRLSAQTRQLLRSRDGLRADRRKWLASC